MIVAPLQGVNGQGRPLATVRTAYRVSVQAALEPRTAEAGQREGAAAAASAPFPWYRHLCILDCMELIFEVRDAEEGGFCARALGHAIFAQGETWEELRANVVEAAALHFEDGPLQPRLVQLHYVKDELIPLEAAALRHYLGGPKPGPPGPPGPRWGSLLSLSF